MGCAVGHLKCDWYCDRQATTADAERRRAEAAAERERATTERARAEVDAAELEEQLRAHQATQVSMLGAGGLPFWAAFHQRNYALTVRHGCFLLA